VDDHEPQGFLGIVGASDPMHQLFAQLRLFAPYEETVLIQGESGTGKELVARALHTLSPRSAGPFVAVNCAALPENLLESEFFGHVRGAFTGAVRDRIGAVEKASGGTLFLDEIGELSVGLQAKLLRFLQERRYSRVGEHNERLGAARILAATNREFSKSIALGHFREDLYFRLNVLPLPVPPLRERPTDIPLLVDHFLRDAAGPGQAPKRAPRELLELFLRHPWPGNVRELQNTVKYLAILSPGSQLQVAALPPSFRGVSRDREDGHDGSGHRSPASSGQGEKSQILAALREAGGNRARAARALGMHRTTLYRKMAVLGITPFPAPGDRE
jgi:transcriptional regulator with PAS, ATPase and Fis domain